MQLFLHSSSAHGFCRRIILSVERYVPLILQVHEALGIYKGTALLQFGGDGNAAVQERVQAGDVLIIPAGGVTCACISMHAQSADKKQILVHSCRRTTMEQWPSC